MEKYCFIKRSVYGYANALSIIPAGIKQVAILIGKELGGFFEFITFCFTPGSKDGFLARVSFLAMGLGLIMSNIIIPGPEHFHHSFLTAIAVLVIVFLPILLIPVYAAFYDCYIDKVATK